MITKHLGTLIYLDKILDTLLPEEMYDFDEDDTEDSIYEELYEEYKRESQFVDYHNTAVTLEDLREMAQKIFKNRKRNRRKNEEIAFFVSIFRKENNLCQSIMNFT
jgi:hypothetical protein